MNEEFVNLVDQAAELFRKRSLRQLGASQLSGKILPLIKKHISLPLEECSTVLIGDALVEIFTQAIESLTFETGTADSPSHRQYVYLYEYLVEGKEWKTISDELFLSRSAYYEVKQVATERLATIIWHHYEAATMNKILHNLSNPSYTIFTEVCNEHGKQYVDEVVIPTLKSYRGWTIALVGEPGVGKSSIAREVADRIVKESNKYNLPFEAVIWISCRRDVFNPEANKPMVVTVIDSMEQVYEVIGKTLGNLQVLQNSVAEKRGIVDKLLKEFVCLLIVDNLDSEWTSEGFKEDLQTFIRELPRPHMSLVTKRPEKMMWEGARNIKINPMSKEVAANFLKEEAIDRGVLPFTQLEFNHLYEKTHGVPIAMKLVLGLTKVGPYSLEEALDFGEYNRKVLEFMFEKAYKSLPDHAKKVLLSMRLFGDKASAEALEYASGVTGPERVDAIGRLYRSYMIEKIQDGGAEPSYTLLPFFREYLRGQEMVLAKDKVDKWISPDFFYHASDRVADYFINLLNVGKDRRENGLLLLKSERQNIINAMSWCWERKNTKFIEILDLIGPNLGTLRLIDDRINWGNRAVELLKEKGDMQKASWYKIRDVAWSYLSKGTPDSLQEGQRILEHEYSLAVKNDWQNNRALSIRNLAKLSIEDGKFDEAERFLRESMEIWEKLGDSYWKTVTKHRIADLKVKQQLYPEAYGIFEIVEAEYKRIGYRDGKTEVMCSRAKVLILSGKKEMGLMLLDAAIAEAEQITPPAHIYAFAYKTSSEIKEICGDIKSALADAKLARDTFEALGMKYNVDQLNERMRKLEGKV